LCAKGYPASYIKDSEIKNLSKIFSDKNNFTTIKNQNSSLNIRKISPVQKGLVVNA